MKKILSLLSLSLCWAATLSVAQDAPSNDIKIQDLAKNFESKIDLSHPKIQYNLPADVNVKILGSTLKQLIDLEGQIRQPISDLTTIVTFELSKGEEKVSTEALSLKLKGTLVPNPSGNPKVKVIPEVQEWVGGTGYFTPGKKTRIFMTKGDAKTGHPDLEERMDIFADEYDFEIEKVSGCPLNWFGDKPKAGDIAVELKDIGAGDEGYRIETKDGVLHITAKTPVGAFWATRTLAQVFKQENNRFPNGILIDYPQYPVRGLMYDVGRKPASLEHIYNIMKMMSYYKMNDFQLHLSDNYIWMANYTKIPNDKNATAEQKKAAIQEVLDANPSGFRLESKVVGKNGLALTSEDCFYTKKQFGNLVDDAREYGVNIVPELDVPGHSMSLVRVRPELMYRGQVTKQNDVERTAMLDASHDVFDPATGKTYRQETMDYVKSVFDEYMDSVNGEKPVFRDAVVHIGTDEYYGDSEDFRAFADELLKYIRSKGFTPRYWGNLDHKRGKTPVTSDGVQMHIWSNGWQAPQSALDMGYDIINILDGHSYIVPSGSGSVGGYGDFLDLRRNYSQAWHPNIMGNKVVTPGHPKLLGAQFALWNDNSFIGDKGLIDYDLFDRVQQSAAVYAEKTWNTGAARSYDDFLKLTETVDMPPHFNPTYRNHAKPGETLYEADFENKKFDDKENVEFSAGKTGKALCLKGGKSYVENDLENIAPPYAASFWVKRNSDSKEEQVLFSSATGTFKAVQKGTGKVGLTRDTWDYSFDYELPTNEWVQLTVVATADRKVNLLVNGVDKGTIIRSKFPESHKFSSFVFPIETIGAKVNAFKGCIDDVKIIKK